MNDSHRKKRVAALCVNFIIFLVAAVVASIGFFFGAGDGQVGTYVIGVRYFIPYTMDSNVLGGLASGILCVYGIVSLYKKEDVIPRWAVVLQLMATSCLTLTMLIAVCFLAPMKVMEGESYFLMFQEDMFFFHFLNPVLSIISFTCLQKEHKLSKKCCIWGGVPTVIYSLIYFVMVVIVKRWTDHYNFTFGGRYQVIPFVVLVIYSLVLAIALGLIWGHNKE